MDINHRREDKRRNQKHYIQILKLISKLERLTVTWVKLEPHKRAKRRIEEPNKEETDQGVANHVHVEKHDENVSAEWITSPPNFAEITHYVKAGECWAVCPSKG